MIKLMRQISPWDDRTSLLRNSNLLIVGLPRGGPIRWQSKTQVALFKMLYADINAMRNELHVAIAFS